MLANELIPSGHPLKKNYSSPFNRIITGMNEIQLIELGVHPFPQFRDDKTGDVPVLAVVKFLINGEPHVWPSHHNPKTGEYAPGRWFKSMDEWEKEEEVFRAMADEELQKQSFITADKNIDKY